jgi:vacuole morphology and inheritance protein 14
LLLTYVFFVSKSHLLARKYLSDPTEDVRIAAENQLAEFLREIREVTIVRKHREEQQRLREIEPEEKRRAEPERGKGRTQDIAVLPDTERVSFPDSSLSLAPTSEVEKPNGDVESDVNERDPGGASLRCIPTNAHFI